MTAEHDILTTGSPRVVRRQRRRHLLSPGLAQLLHLLGLGPVLPLQPVEEDEARHEAEVEQQHHDHRRDDGGLRAADVARVPDICINIEI